ncbi:MAG: 50S ribosomal protein L21 [Deltaproteobacteria bacterium]|nr:50S ribosomal protein L21 [Deltaproteobacteria bacterium]MBW2069758.1 50S ribosomal protein L21 [Deltaproteobacteria bacterium]
MYAVVRTGGKQYTVSPGDVIRVEKIDAAVGDMVPLDDVLMVNDGDKLHVDRETLSNTQVTARVRAQVLGRKIIVFKYKRRKGYRKKQGHRQRYTELLIEGIQTPEMSSA